MNELICAFGLTFIFMTFIVLFSIILTASCSYWVYEKRVDRNTIIVCIVILILLSIGLICFSKYNSIEEKKNEELKNLYERIEKLEKKGEES